MAQRVHYAAGTSTTTKYICRKGPSGDMETSAHSLSFRQDAPKRDRTCLPGEFSIGRFMTDKYIIGTNLRPSLFDISVNRITYRNRHWQRKRCICLLLNDGDASVPPVDITEFQVDDITCTETHFDPRHHHGDPTKFYRAVIAFSVLFDPLALIFRQDIHDRFSGSAPGIDT